MGAWEEEAQTRLCHSLHASICPIVSLSATTSGHNCKVFWKIWSCIHSSCRTQGDTLIKTEATMKKYFGTGVCVYEAKYLHQIPTGIAAYEDFSSHF